MNRARPRLDWLAIWILWSAWCTLCGWGLSAVGHLDRAGYAVALPLFLAGVYLTRRYWTVLSTRRLFLFRRSTYRRLAPKLWLLLALVSFVEGLLYHGDNYDYLTYRIPRLLHWWWMHHWYWVGSTNLRIDLSVTGFEWLMAPLFVVFESDRPFFLINIVSYLMLPGLIFSVLRSLRVNARVAWWTMWVVPSALCYALQAGGLGNDMFAGVYLLAAFHYTAKIRPDSASALGLAILSMGLLSNAKASNIPLALPWLVLLFFFWRRFPRGARNWGALAVALLVGLAVSAEVNFALNYHFTGDYTGDPTNSERVQVKVPLLGILGTSIMVAASNLVPPFLPHEIVWHVLPQGLQHQMAQDFSRYSPRSPALPLEESSSFGLGATFFLLMAALYGWSAKSKRAVTSAVKCLAAATGAVWLIFMCKLSSDSPSRLLAPYYLLTVVAVLAVLPFDGRQTHRPVWRGLAYLNLTMALVVVALTPGRPLFPPRLVTATLHILHVPGAVAESWEKNRVLRASHYDALRQMREIIPPSEKRIGLIEGNDIPGTSLWLPFGSREVMEIRPDLSASAVTERGIHYVVVNDEFLTKNHLSQAALLDKWSARVIFSEETPLKTNQSLHWDLVRLP